MLITILYACLRKPSTIVERTRLGNAENWHEETITLDTTPAGAFEWIENEGKKIKGFTYRGMQPVQTGDFIPARPTAFKPGKLSNGDSEAELILRSAHRRPY